MPANASRLGALAAVTLLACGASAPNRPEEKKSYAQNLLGGLERTAVEKTRADMLAIRTAIFALQSQSGAPPEGSDLDALAAAIAPTYIRVVPRRDAWGHDFRYAVGQDGFLLRAVGADGTPGTKDDLALDGAGFTEFPEGYRPVM